MFGLYKLVFCDIYWLDDRLNDTNYFSLMEISFDRYKCFFAEIFFPNDLN